MRDYFIQLFNYDRYVNLKIADVILKTDNHSKAEQLMAHMLVAQQIWLNRCKKLPAVGGALWPDWKAETFEQIITDNHAAWIDFLEHLEPEHFNDLITYKNLKGEDFENKLSDILAHVINHGTHHRAQAGQHLKLADADLPVTDLIFYIREFGN
jgi:uncharacterized damage-inducible protein DinB